MSQEVNAQDELVARKERLQDLKDMGIDPFGSAYKRTHKVLNLINDWNEAEPKGEEATTNLGEYCIAGRIMNQRSMGKAAFGNLQDLTGSIQFYLRKDSVSEEEFLSFKKLYVGDIIGIKGTLFKTKKDELSVRVSELTILSCALRPLPEKFHGLTDKELRYRKRYLDLIVNEKARNTFITRSKLISSFRKTLDAQDYIEVETPVLHSIPGGAAARPFVTHHNALDMEFYMRIATELHLKRLLVGGLEKVYEIGRIFRNEGISQKHNPEFTTIELYEAYSDFEGMMDLTEELVTNSCMAAHGTLEVPYNGETLNFQRPWKRMRYLDAICELGNINPEDLKEYEKVQSICKERKVDVDPKMPIGKLYDALFEDIVEPTLFQPTFIYDYPKELSPLAKEIPDQPGMTFRFEATVAHMEIANAFSELNDPIDQLDRFQSQVADREQGDDEAHHLDMDYVESLEYAMPPAGGLGIGIDRLTMLLSDNNSIREVILFPHMKNKD
ncbi:MAG: lysine--tRNA ligase [Candidatus Cloacimonetes bacterium]|nr:lysine--tRNA ligase [Candidatus Cloacimonadota bacterium]